MTQVTTKVFLGSLRDAENAKFLADHAISQVIWFSDDPKTLENYQNASSLPPRAFHNLVICDIPDDGDKLIDLCERAADLIDRCSRPTLVHCSQAISRSTSAVIYYIMRRFRYNFDQAFAYVKALHPRTNPNDGFVEALIEVEHRFSSKRSSPPKLMVNPYLAALGYE
jgi:predicted protein tyrosine phosphatase